MFKFLKLFGLSKSPREKLKVLIKNGDSRDSVRNMKKILGLLIKNHRMFSEYHSNIGYYFDLYDKSNDIDTRFRIFKTLHTTNIDTADNYNRYVFLNENVTSDIQESLIVIEGKKKEAKYVRKSKTGEKIKTLFPCIGKMVIKLHEKVNTTNYYLR